MAVDWWLLNNSTVPTVRFYNWTEPTLSLGYRQQFDLPDSVRELFPRFPVVVRPTGGGYLLHAAELTFAFIVPDDAPLASNSIMDFYELVRTAFTRAARSASYIERAQTGAEESSFVADCLAAPGDHEPVQAGRKWLAAAQVRHDGNLLQHGSIFWDAGQWPASVPVNRPFFLTESAPPAERFRFRQQLLSEAATTIFSDNRGRLRQLDSEEWQQIETVASRFVVNDSEALPVFRRDRI